MSKITLNTSFTGLTLIKDWWGVVKSNFLAIVTGHNELEDRINAIITTPAEGVSAQEIIDARKGKASLRDKIDEIDAKIAAGANVVDLFVGSGQSNYQGQSEAAPTPFEIPEGKAYEYKLLTNSLTTVKHPFGENIDDIFWAATNGWGSLSPRFAEAYYNTTGIPPLMVGCAKGATILEQWMKAGSEPLRYAKLVEKVNAAVTCALANGLIVRNKCIVWLQGESDAGASTSKTAYKAQFLTFWENLKTDCGFNKCFIIRVAKFYDYPIQPIIEAQEELAREYDDIVMLTRITGTFTTANGLMQSIWHYTNAGLDLVGTTAGKVAGKYLNRTAGPKLDSKPKLETEPYAECAIAAAGRYEFNYRGGSINEVENKITVSAIGTPDVQATYTAFDGAEGIKLGNPIILHGDATVSLSCLFDAVLNAGAMLVSYDGYTSNDFIFFYHSQTTINLADTAGVTTAKFFNTADIYSKISTYNHYVFYKTGRTYSLYFNGTLVQTLHNGPAILNINNLFYGLASLGLKGKVKHCMINVGAIIPPKEADPAFYANAEQGTT